MNELGLREVVKSEDDRRFELSVTNKRGRAVEVWTMRAATQQLKNDWVARIKKLLMRQFFSIRRTQPTRWPRKNYVHTLVTKNYVHTLAAKTTYM